MKIFAVLMDVSIQETGQRLLFIEDGNYLFVNIIKIIYNNPIEGFILSV